MTTPLITAGTVETTSQGLGALNACAGGRAQADLELAGFDPRENFRSKLAANEYDQRRA